MSDKPTVVFVCNSNAGKSQMAAALMRHAAGDTVEVLSAGVKPASGGTNQESAASCAKLGATFEGEYPKLFTEEMQQQADYVINVGGNATFDLIDGTDAALEVWPVDEPSLRGVEGEERMDDLRDQINAKVLDLLERITADQK